MLAFFSSAPSLASPPAPPSGLVPSPNSCAMYEPCALPHAASLRAPSGVAPASRGRAAARCGERTLSNVCDSACQVSLGAQSFAVQHAGLHVIPAAVCACVRARVRVRVRACVRACSSAASSVGPASRPGPLHYCTQRGACLATRQPLSARTRRPPAEARAGRLWCRRLPGVRHKHPRCTPLCVGLVASTRRFF